MDYIREISDYTTRKSRPFVQQTALLVIDMQRFFDPIGRPVKGAVNLLIETCRLAGAPVIYTRHGHHDFIVDGGMLAQWWGNDLSIYGSPEWELMDGISPLPKEHVIDKTRYSAFFGTGLEAILRDATISDLIITGVMTNCCCETTARDGFMRDFRIFIAADATATTNDELHIASLKGMAFSCAYIMTTKDLCSALKEEGAGGNL